MQKIMEWISVHKRKICFVSLLVTVALSVYWYKSGILTDEIKMRHMLSHEYGIIEKKHKMQEEKEMSR